MIFCEMCYLQIYFHRRIFCELILFFVYIKDNTFMWKTKCISNLYAPPYPSIEGHREKLPKLLYLIGDAHHSVRTALYPSQCKAIASSLNYLSIRVCPMSIGLVVPELSSRHCTNVPLFFFNVERQIYHVSPMAKFAGPHEHTCWGTFVMTLGSHLVVGSLLTYQISTKII